MRIAIFSWESLHSVTVGGVGVHATELAAGLQRRGHEVHVFVRLGENQNTYDVVDGVHYHRCPIDLHPDFVTEMNNMSNSFVYFMRQTESYQGAYFDIVHGHDWLCAKGIVQAKNDCGRSRHESPALLRNFDSRTVGSFPVSGRVAFHSANHLMSTSSTSTVFPLSSSIYTSPTPGA